MKLFADDYAVYLPAINTLFAEALVKPIPDGRPFPEGLCLDDLAFWLPNKLWYHPYILHSVGQYAINSTPDNAITRRGRTDGFLFGDSGGYQIGKGSLRGMDTLQAGMSADQACTEWRNAYAIRRWIVDWLETYTNYAMTIDMPLWVREERGRNSPFHTCSAEQLQTLTVENLQFIDSHRQGRTKWLNVLQGQDIDAIKRWWKAVKWFPCSGYALGGDAGYLGGLHSHLSAILMLRDSHALAKGHDWLHLLGVSTAKWSVILTAVQRAIQEHLNPNLRISYDSATPFQHAAVREDYVEPLTLGSASEGWRFVAKKCPQSILNVGSDEPLPFSSPLADQMTLGHFSVSGGQWDKNQFDRLSRLFLTHHNVWIFLDGMRRANESAFSDARTTIPPALRECVDFIGELLTMADPYQALENQKGLFREFERI